ncbi:MAG: lipoate--protein ligase family protein [Candidatus Krumholzibacteriota bacterium]
MARDEHIFNRVRRNPDQIILRTYSFEPPCISIGFHQDPEEALDLRAVSGDGIDLVKRITGGRALLHHEEFTYCITAGSQGDIFGARLGETFIRISEVLIEALRSLGVRASLSGGRKQRERSSNSPCLASVSRYEITAGGKKIMGSAQRRWGEFFLQHGSILRGKGSRMISRYLPGGWQDVSERITSLCEQAGSDPGYEKIRDAVREAFTRLMGADFERLVLSEKERDEIDCAASGKSEIMGRY